MRRRRSSIAQRVHVLVLAARVGAAALVGAGLALMAYAVGLAYTAGCASSQPAGYPTPAAAASYDLQVTDCAVTGESRAAIDECRLEAAHLYCTNYPAMAMCPKDGGSQ